jgi:cell division initiation protein
MPDQSSAATEHAILSEIIAPLASLPDDPVALLNVDFPLALRGYDRLAVDDYVKQTAQLVAELQATRSPEAAVRRALERVGEQISGILQRAHEAAGEITTQSRSEAEDRLEQSRREASEITAEAEQRVKDLDADTDRIWAERHRIVDDARGLANELLALAQAAAERFPPADEPLHDPAEEAPALYDVEAAAGGQLDPAQEGPGGDAESTAAPDVESAAAARSDLADEPLDDPPDWETQSTAVFPAADAAAEGEADPQASGAQDEEADAVIPPVPQPPNRRSDR